MTDATNVVTFAPRPKPEPAPAPLLFVEVRLRDESCNLQMNLCDSEGNVFTLEYQLKSSPDPDLLNRLRLAWADWRGGSCAAS